MEEDIEGVGVAWGECFLSTAILKKRSANTAISQEKTATAISQN